MQDIFAKRWPLALSLAKCERRARLGLSFAIFGGLCLAYMPALFLLKFVLQPWPKLFAVLNRRMSQLAFRIVIATTTALGLIRVRFHGTSHPTALMVSNHVSLLDVLFILGRFRDCFTFVHSKFHKNPLMGPIISGSNYIVVDRSSIFNRKLAMDRAAEVLRGGGQIVIFPEGTRSRNGMMGALEDGAFRLAAQLAIPITPVFILATDSLLNKTGWHRVPLSRVVFDVYLGDPISCSDNKSIKETIQAMREEFVARYRSLLATHGATTFNGCPNVAVRMAEISPQAICTPCVSGGDP